MPIPRRWLNRNGIAAVIRNMERRELQPVAAIALRNDFLQCNCRCNRARIVGRMPKCLAWPRRRAPPAAAGFGGRIARQSTQSHSQLPDCRAMRQPFFDSHREIGVPNVGGSIHPNEWNMQA
ncbi:hypothetical protein [Derxia lacustris]|uniref:hypothetical protein n=1 Tax=Derxia lacustris TaxID=764842 RepID=UPI00111BE522|nr:hypothetical protein [Derxia lacustris]